MESKNNGSGLFGGIGAAGGLGTGGLGAQNSMQVIMPIFFSLLNCGRLA